MGAPVVTVIGITGSGGFLGWHLRCRLATLGWKFATADRDTFNNPTLLDDFIAKSDVVVHLAGVNRATTGAEIHDGNLSVAAKLLAATERVGTVPNIVFSNSIQAGGAGPYGESKAAVAQALDEATAKADRVFVNIRFPHLFGEFGRPFYNSAVSTFAYQLSRGEESEVNDGLLELLHAQEAAQIIIDCAAAERSAELSPPGTTLSVQDCYQQMRSIAEPYVENGTFPAIGDDPLRLRLFNTIRSQMWPQHYPRPLVRHADDRGAFFEAVRAWGQGQTSVSTTVPGITRGEHYHRDKIERFVVLAGEAEIRVRRLFTDDLVKFSVRGDEPVVIDMPPLCTHDITNTGSSELVTLFWSHDHFDPEAADTFLAPVERRGASA